MRKFVLIFLFFSYISLNAYAEKKELNHYLKICTTSGDITVKLYNATPLHRDNIIKLCKEGYYDNILFHRVIDKFVIQAGDPQSREHEAGKLYGDGGPAKNLPAEIRSDLFHKRGVLAAARESDTDNPLRESSASQFYIVTGRIQSDKDLDEAEAKVNKRNLLNNIKTEYKISTQRREIYKNIGGVPHLDTQYTIFGEVIEGMDIVDKISIVETDENDRPKSDIWIISTKIFKKREQPN